MIYQYAVTLKNNNARLIDRSSLFLLAISMVLFIREQVNSPHQLKISYLFGALAIGFIVLRNYLVQRGDPFEPVRYRYALFIAAIVWVTMPYLPWLFLPFTFMGVFERQAKMPLEIGFTDNAVIFNTIFRRRYKWTDFNNIILKDDLLTLDFKNNRLLQRETVDEEGDAGEDEFNSYCSQQLTRAHAVMS